MKSDKKFADIFRELGLHEKNLASRAEFNALHASVAKFSSFENVQTLTDELFPKIEAFANKIDGFQEDNSLVRQCVRKFDEALSMKVSKASF